MARRNYYKRRAGVPDRLLTARNANYGGVPANFVKTLADLEKSDSDAVLTKINEARNQSLAVSAEYKDVKARKREWAAKKRDLNNTLNQVKKKGKVNWDSPGKHIKDKDVEEPQLDEMLIEAGLKPTGSKKQKLGRINKFLSGNWESRDFRPPKQRAPSSKLTKEEYAKITNWLHSKGFKHTGKRSEVIDRYIRIVKRGEEPIPSDVGSELNSSTLLQMQRAKANMEDWRKTIIGRRMDRLISIKRTLIKDSSIINSYSNAAGSFDDKLSTKSKLFTDRFGMPPPEVSGSYNWQRAGNLYKKLIYRSTNGKDLALANVWINDILVKFIKVAYREGNVHQSIANLVWIQDIIQNTFNDQFYANMLGVQDINTAMIQMGAFSNPISRCITGFMNVSDPKILADMFSASTLTGQDLALWSAVLLKGRHKVPVNYHPAEKEFHDRQYEREQAEHVRRAQERDAQYVAEEQGRYNQFKEEYPYDPEAEIKVEELPDLTE